MSNCVSRLHVKNFTNAKRKALHEFEYRNGCLLGLGTSKFANELSNIVFGRA